MAFTKRPGQYPGYTHKETVAGGATSDSLVVPPLPGSEKVTITVIPGANSGLVEFTTSPDSEITAATATWHEWPSGTVTQNTIDYIDSPITGLRFSATGGDVDFEVVI